MRNTVQWLADRSWSVSGTFFNTGVILLALSVLAPAPPRLPWCASGAMVMGALVWVGFGRSRGRPVSPASALVLLAFAALLVPLYYGVFGLLSNHPGIPAILVMVLWGLLWANHEWRRRRGTSLTGPEEPPVRGIGDQRPLSRVERNGLAALVAALVALGWWLSGGRFHQPSLAHLPASAGVAVFFLVMFRVLRYAMSEESRFIDPAYLDRWQSMTPLDRRVEWAWALGLALLSWALLESMVGHQVWGAVAITYVLADALLPVRVFVGWGLAGPPSGGPDPAGPATPQPEHGAAPIA